MEQRGSSAVLGMALGDVQSLCNVAEQIVFLLQSQPHPADDWSLTGSFGGVGGDDELIEMKRPSMIRSRRD
jgi:hypothetical protein